MPIKKTKAGKERGGGAFNKQTVLNWLQNQTYLGKMPHKENFYEGKHEAIIPEKLFIEVGQILDKNRESKRSIESGSFCKILGSP
jgi:site-specific DNA recombinase